MRKFYVTTAIAYPNGKPHMGHALEIIQADIIARFQKMLGKDVFFQTGTDEHGTKNWQTAKKEGKDIYKFLDENVAVFKKLYDKLNICYDNFIRTSDRKLHHPGAQKLWKRLVKSEDIYKKKYKGLYCVGCESFKTEKELVEGKCPDHPTKEIEEIEEENYFFKLSKYREKIARVIESDEYRVIPRSRKNEILSFLKDAKDISFSRNKKSMPWGIPVPEDEEHVMYVWCDALSNYITGIGYGTDKNKFEKLWPCDVHVIGKDILRFHAAFWPAMLMSAGIDIPKRLFVHGFVLSKGSKMGKSTGNVIEPFEQIEKYGVDQFRYYLAGSMPMDGDGDYSEDLVIERINNELVGNLSNFCYRVMSFTNKNYDSEIKDVDEAFFKEISSKFSEIAQAYEDYDLKKAIEIIMHVSALGNQYFQSKEPWKNKENSQNVLGTCINLVKDLAILVNPIMPEFSEKLQKQLNLNDLRWEDLDLVLKNHKIDDAEIIFRRVEIDSKKGDTQKKEKKSNVTDDQGNKQDKFPLNLRVAEVKEAEAVEDSEKLVKMQLDIGTEKRQIVAGIKKFFSAEELIGKKIIIVSNLKKAKLAGIESQGMLLAASKDDKLALLNTDAEPGTLVYPESMKANIRESQIKIKDVMKVNFEVKDKRVYANSNMLKTDTSEVIADIEDGADIS